jgi:two-component system cell cycle sensor histidine kinase/response regulator CckA
MHDPSKKHQELLEEISFLNKKIKEFEISEAERKQTEKALRDSELRYKTIFEMTGTAMVIIEEDMVISLANDGFETLSGCARAEVEGKKKWTEFVDKGDLEKMITRHHLRRMDSGNVPKSYEFRFVHREGRLKNILLTIDLIPGTKKSVASLMDITERKQMEEALSKSRYLLSDLIEHSSALICVKDREGHYSLVNNKWEEVTGLKRQDIIGRTDEEMFPGPVGKQFRLNDLEVMESESALEKEEILEDEHGTRFFISNKFPLREKDGVVGGLCGMITEITERKRMERALRESDELYRTFINATPDMVFLKDEQLRNIVVNRSLAEFFGKQERSIIGKSDFELMPQEAAEECRQTDLEALKSASVVVSEEMVGDQVFETFKFPVDLGDNRTGVGGFIRNITVRRHAEEMSRQSEEKFYKVFMTAPCGISISRMTDGLIIDTNHGFKEISGWERSEVIGWTVLELNFWNDPADRAFLVDELKAGRDVIHREMQFRKKDGILRSGIYSARPIEISGEACIIFILSDVTEHKQAEEAIRESERRLSDIIEFFPDATLVIDKEGKVIAWNRAIETMTGINKEDMLGKGDYEYAIPFYGERKPILIDYALHTDNAVEKQYTAFQRMGDVLFGEAFTPNLPPGNIHLSGTASILRDERGEIIAAIECIRDNTERKRLEERLNRAEKMESLGTLAGGVAHDLNNVLGILVGYSELLMEKLPEETLLRNYADNILQSSIRSAAIIQDLLTLARRGVTVSDVVNLNMVVSDYFKTPEFEKLKSFHPDVRICAELADGLLNIKGSPVHLSKTIMNLVSNAAESISGSGEVTIKTKNRYLDQLIQGYDEMKEGDYAVLMVSDTGGGIPSEDLNKIFEPFYTKKTMGRSGTGLGLAVVWGTVKDHHGYIDVKSEEGKGTTFTLYFPVTREESGKIEKAISPVAYMGKGESILVVDDVKEQRELAISMLGRLGYQAAAVAGGDEAIEYLKNKKADLLLLDMVMDPGMDGMETYRRILEIKPGQRAVIASGFSETDQVRKTQEMGAGAFVRKPYILEHIGLAVKKELGK